MAVVESIRAETNYFHIKALTRNFEVKVVKPAKRGGQYAKRQVSSFS